MKKGLIIVYDPHNLYQFLWYYCSYGKEIEWDALCLPNEGKGEYMGDYCEKTGIFKNIYRYNTEYTHMNSLGKAKIFLQMIAHALTHRQKEYCYKLLKQYVDIERYDTIVVMTDVGFVTGACLAFGKEKKVVILEDGLGDYAERTNKYLLEHITNPYDWQGFLLANMGYSNVGHYYPLKTTKDCDKFCSHPDFLNYTKYKTMNKLYDFSNTDMDLFHSLVEKIYPLLKEYDYENVDVILFTEALNCFSEDTKKYLDIVQKYVLKNYNSVLLKKHPLDQNSYKFESSITVQEVPSSIPAEVLFPYITGKKILFMNISSVLFYLNEKHENIDIFYFEGLYEKCMQENTFLKYMDMEEFKEKLRSYKMEDINIIIK